MKKSIGLALAACAATLGSAAVSAGSDVGSWYFAPQIQGIWLEDVRAADDDIGFALAFGKAVSKNWNIEIGGYQSSHDATLSRTLKTSGIDLAAQRVFYREQNVNPFMMVGIGRRSENLTGANSSQEFFVKYGVGLLADLAKRAEKGTNLQARAELFARRGDDAAGNNAVDYVAGLGLQYSWGAPIVKKVIDSDGDGVPDDMDKCPNTPAGTPVNADGCPLDSDGDGVIDPNDKCPNTPPNTRVDANGCELDSDGDGVVDSKDKCPNTPAGTAVNADGCPMDSDGDGVVDSKDRCPDTPKGDRVDAFGCSFTTELRLPGVVFDTDKAVLRPESFEVLDGAVETLKRYPELKVEVAGHTDSVGSDAYNRTLSQERAATVLGYLRDKGVTNALSSRGYGESQPIASNANEAGRLENRRVALLILSDQ